MELNKRQLFQRFMFAYVRDYMQKWFLREARNIMQAKHKCQEFLYVHSPHSGLSFNMNRWKKLSLLQTEDDQRFSVEMSLSRFYWTSFDVQISHCPTFLMVLSQD